MVCFDFEGALGMPHQVPYDLAEATTRLLGVLARYDARAVFFVVGRLIHDQPDVVRAIAAAGHEIGLHGYSHEHLDRLTDDGLASFEADLTEVEAALERLTGRRPRCFRAPYLLEPRFYRREVNDILRRHGYTWVSNLELRHPVELLRPDAAQRLRRGWRRKDGSPRVARSRLISLLINTSVLRQRQFGRSVLWRLWWLALSRAPFLRDGLLEVPVFGPLDCDLLGLPAPADLTPPGQLDYARASVRALAHSPAPVAMITFHDWIVAGGNRLILLSDVLEAAVDAGLPVSTSAGPSTRQAVVAGVSSVSGS